MKIEVPFFIHIPVAQLPHNLARILDFVGDLMRKGSSPAMISTVSSLTIARF